MATSWESRATFGRLRLNPDRQAFSHGGAGSSKPSVQHVCRLANRSTQKPTSQLNLARRGVPPSSGMIGCPEAAAWWGSAGGADATYIPPSPPSNQPTKQPTIKSNSQPINLARLSRGAEGTRSIRLLQTRDGRGGSIRLLQTRDGRGGWKINRRFVEMHLQPYRNTSAACRSVEMDLLPCIYGGRIGAPIYRNAFAVADSDLIHEDRGWLASWLVGWLVGWLGILMEMQTSLES